MPNKFTSRFAELTVEAGRLAKIEEIPNDHEDSQSNAVLTWTLMAKHLLSIACGEDSNHYREFDRSDLMHRGFGAAYRLRLLGSIFAAARDDFENGYFTTVRTFVQAEVFGSEIEQARELLDSGYKTAAAVTAGIVLETAIRELCDRNGIVHGKLDRMNVDLAKKGVYNLLMQTGHRIGATT